MAGHEILELAQHRPQMRPRRLRGAQRATPSDRLEDRSVLNVGSRAPPRRGEQCSANPVKMHAKGIKRLADALEVQRIRHLTMEPRVEFMKAREIAAIERGALITQVPTHLIDRLVGQLGRAARRDLDFEQATHHHPLLDVRQPDLADVRTALRLDYNKALEGEPVNGAGYL